MLADLEVIMTGGSNQAAHDALKRDILIWLGQWPDILVENNPTGRFQHLYRKAVITVGAPGRPDVTGVWSVPIDTSPSARYVGLAFAVEAKTGQGQLGKLQRRWRDRFEALGGHYVLARSVEDVIEAFPPGGPRWMNVPR
jgi:hypothetical protein